MWFYIDSIGSLALWRINEGSSQSPICYIFLGPTQTVKDNIFIKSTLELPTVWFTQVFLLVSSLLTSLYGKPQDQVEQTPSLTLFSRSNFRYLHRTNQKEKPTYRVSAHSIQRDCSIAVGVKLAGVGETRENSNHIKSFNWLWNGSVWPPRRVGCVPHIENHYFSQSDL